MVRCGCNAASATTCDAIVLCVAANLGPGLRYDGITGLLAVRISGDVGNAASFGSDGGIYVPGGDAVPDPASGRRTVAGLPERAAGGSATGGGSMTPFGSPYGIEYAVANRLDIIHISNFALADGVSIARWDGPLANLENRTDNPSSIDSQLISSVQLPSLLVDAGARNTPTGRASGAPAVLLSPDGGWFGFYANNFSPMTLTDALHKVAARAVVFVAVIGSQIESDMERHLAGAARSVLQAQSQAWTLFGVPGYMDDGAGNVVPSPISTWVGDIAAAGITPIVDLFDDSLGGFAVTPAQVVATGAEWVRLAHSEDGPGATRARIQTFLDEGLQVYVQPRSSRQWDAEQLWDMGVRAISSDSPVYTRGARGEAGDLDYRKEIVIPGLITRTVMEGSLTSRTNDGMADNDVGWPRQSDVGRNFSAQFGWIGGIGAHLHSQLLGEICPYEVTSNYRLRLRFRVDPTQASAPAGSVPKLGIFFNSPDDRDITYYEPDDGPAHVNGYWATIRVGTTNPGLVVLGKFNNGNFTILDDSIDTPGAAIGQWIIMAVETTPTGIVLSISHPGSGGTLSTTVADTDHRGPYAFYGWEDDYLLPADNAGFAHGYSAYEDFATGFPMYEDLS
jgi:hypothetical protein